MEIDMRAARLAGGARLAGSVWAQPLTLDQAVERAIAASPELRAGEAGVDAARAGQLQARVRPNPTVSVDMENGVGTGGYGLFRQSEPAVRSEEHTSELQSLMRILYAVFCLYKKIKKST